MHFNFANRQLRGDLDVKLGDQIISQVTKFKYLESIIRQDDEIDQMSIIEFKLGGVSGGKLLEFFVIGKYLIRLKGSFIILLLDQQYYMVVNIGLQSDNMNIKWGLLK